MDDGIAGKTAFVPGGAVGHEGGGLGAIRADRFG